MLRDERHIANLLYADARGFDVASVWRSAMSHYQTERYQEAVRS
jgi:hypothetical protein